MTTADFSALYNAQKAAKREIDSYLRFVSQDYLRTWSLIPRSLLVSYNGVRYSAHLLTSGLYAIAAKTYALFLLCASVGDFLFGWAFRRLYMPVINAVYPVSLINGQRHVVLLSRNFEKTLGDWFFYPIALLEMRRSISPDATMVEGLLQRLKEVNGDLLAPAEQKVHFDYRVETIESTELNAFCIMGGGMVVYRELINCFTQAIKSEKIKSAVVHLAERDVTVDLSAVGLEDVLSSVLGHEMTHAAARHSALTFPIDMLAKAIGALLKGSGLMSQTNIEKIEQLFDLFSSSRSQEYEADVTGAYLAHQAGCNPLGALLGQEIMLQSAASPLATFISKHLEFLFAHPCEENRKRALYVAINSFAPQVIEQAVVEPLSQEEQVAAGLDPLINATNQ